MSTAYSNADKQEVDEMVYTPPHDPQSIINCIETLPPDAVNALTEKLIVCKLPPSTANSSLSRPVTS